MFKSRSLLFIATILLLGACRNNNEERAIKGVEYFPIKVGTVNLYQVDTFTFNSFDHSEKHVTHELREEVKEVLLDAALDTVYRIELSIYDASKSEWRPFRSFLRKIKGNYAIETMENVTEVKMIFPIAQYKTKGSNYVWNANMFNAREPVMVKYSSVFSSYNNGIKGFNDCVVIKLNKPMSGIVNDIREEVYSRSIGLVYRFIDSTDFLVDTSFKSGKQIYVRLK